MHVLQLSHRTTNKINLNFELYLFLQQLHTAKNRLQGDFVGWLINRKHFQSGKTMEISFLDEKPYPTHASHRI